MPDFVRVLDKDTGHKRSVPASELPHGNYERLDEPAVHEVTGDLLPTEFGTPESLSSSKSTNRGPKAENSKE